VDKLTGEDVKHWTGKLYPLIGIITVDGKFYRFMGVNESLVRPFIGNATTTEAVQTSVQVMPTQTFYTFTCGAVQLNLVFTAPLLLDDLDLLSTPINYISYSVTPLDNATHNVQVCIGASTLWCVNTEDQEVRIEWNIANNGSISFVRSGTTSQNILGRTGDDVRIDWGYFYLAAMQKSNITVLKDCLGIVDDFGDINSSQNSFVMIGYDDLYSIQYFQNNRRAYWTHDGTVTINQALDKSYANYDAVTQRCQEFDLQLMTDATNAGNKEYAELCAICYRQTIAAHKLITDTDGNLLWFSKENFSNGSIGTVDVTYPSAPLFLIYNTDFVKGMLNPIFYYAESGKWDRDFAPHDTGTYPKANGQTYGGDMPVEESGNILILTTAICLRDGNGDYAKKHWTVLTRWANYLIEQGFDPGDQLCTDDFAGKLAHNANLSIKAIMGIAGYGVLAGLQGQDNVRDEYLNRARQFASDWVDIDRNGDHFQLTFDVKDSWSQKYNLVWDKLWGLNLFPAEVRSIEIAYYVGHQRTYGLPLDNRATYTKSDWINWTACLADNDNDFAALISRVYRYANETKSRIPLSDWHETTNGDSVGFRARSVVGGYFMKLLFAQ
jgi:hypothetical protein